MTQIGFYLLRTKRNPISELRNPGLTIPRLETRCIACPDLYEPPRTIFSSVLINVFYWTLWINGSSRKIKIIMIPSPFPNIATHVVQTPGILFKLGNRLRLAAVATPPGNSIDIRSPSIDTCETGTCSIFPLCFSRKPIAVGNGIPRSIDSFWIASDWCRCSAQALH